MNKVVLIGRLTKDPELRYTPNGVAVASFTLAVDRAFAKTKEGQQQADFIPIIVWKKAAENCVNYIGKGRLVAVSGRLQVRTYEMDDGQRRWITEVIAEQIKFLDYAKNKKTDIEEEIENDLEDIPF